MFLPTAGQDIYLISESQSMTHLTSTVFTSLAKSLLSQLGFVPICEAVVGYQISDFLQSKQDKVRKFEFELSMSPLWLAGCDAVLAFEF